MKILRNVLLGVLALLMVLSGLTVWFVRRPWSQVSGNTPIPGLSASVQVIRDSWGVPNIYAQNEHDLFQAQGYVHAQDRLWIMYFFKHTASGSLSEVVGKDGLEADKPLRVIGLRRGAEREWASMDAEFARSVASVCRRRQCLCQHPS